MLKNSLCLFLLFCLPAFFFSQIDSMTMLRFDFNDHKIREANDKVSIKPVGVSLVADRFGNEKSAVYVFGHATSYINLGSSNLLKPQRGTIAMWLNQQGVVLAGKGYYGTPYLIIKNGPGEDFIIGIGFSYGFRHKRICALASRDSLKEVNVFAKDTVTLDKWQHLAVSYDDNYFSFYVDGELQGKMIKGFESKFFEGDSVILGRTTGTKNVRFAQAIYDDIHFFHRVLSEKEILDLYNEPNPNRFKNMLSEVVRYGIIGLGVGFIILVLIIRNKRNLKRQKEYYELHNKINELEIKVIKTQMNPHFVSNSLAAIQDLIYKRDYESAGQYLAKFSFFLRQVLDYSDKNYTTLEEELSIIKLIVELEQLRFKNNFTFTLQVNGIIKPQDVLIPSLITQPFIENAIWHGLLPLEEKNPQLLIRIYMRNRYIYIEIEDNGVGRTAPSDNGGKSSKGTRLAIDKIDSINRLRNSNDYKLEIKDLVDEKGDPEGTRVILELTPQTYEE